MEKNKAEMCIFSYLLTVVPHTHQRITLRLVLYLYRGLGYTDIHTVKRL